MSAADLPPREAMEFDVVIVGAGPAGLAAAIKLKQIAPDVSVVVVEKGSEVGAHILSGAVIDPIGLDRLLPEWRSDEAPVHTAVSSDRFYVLGPSGAVRLPNFAMPPLMSNHGNFIVSLGDVCRYLAQKAEALGVEIYPGFAAAELLFEGDAVAGVATGDMGIGKDGQQKSGFTRGMELRAFGEQRVFAGECHARRVAVLMSAVAGHAHIAGDDAFDLTARPEDRLRHGDAGIDLDAQGFGLLAKPAAETAEAADIAAVIAHERRHQECREPHPALLAEIVEAVLGDWGGERAALFAPVGQKAVERDWIDHRARQDMGPDLCTLLEHDDGDLLVILGRELLQPDGAGEPRRPGAHDHDVEFHGLALGNVVQSFAPGWHQAKGSISFPRKRESSIP